MVNHEQGGTESSGELATSSSSASPTAGRYGEAVERAWAYLMDAHWSGDVLAGPDPVGRLNNRVWRFVKNYVGAYRLNDRHVFMQTQGYWTLANWILSDATGDSRFSAVARSCAKGIAADQEADGSWIYPRISYERRGLIATVEGLWAAIGLLSVSTHSADEGLAESVRAWDRFVRERIGYHVTLNPEYGECWAVNYYAPTPRGMIPNNTALLINYNSLASTVLADDMFRDHDSQLLNFLQIAQASTGELYYQFPVRQHYLCYQYNAYQFIDLASAYRRRGEVRLLPILQRLGSFLLTGQNADGSSLTACGMKKPQFFYHTAALGHAFMEAYLLGFGDEFAQRSQSAFDYLVGNQLENGSWGHSRDDYGGLLSDSRSYPRYLAMTLYHLARANWPQLYGGA